MREWRLLKFRGPDVWPEAILAKVARLVRSPCMSLLGR